MAGPRLVPRPFASAAARQQQPQQQQPGDVAMSKTERSTYLHYPFPRHKKAPAVDCVDPPKPSAVSSSVSSTALGGKFLGRSSHRSSGSRPTATVSDTSISRSSAGSSTLAQLTRFSHGRSSNQVASSSSLRNDSVQPSRDPSDDVGDGGNNTSPGHSSSSLPTIGELPRLTNNSQPASSNIISISALTSSGANSSFQQRLQSSSRTSPLSSSAAPSPETKKSNPKGLVGLQNLGNTCFMNSCLQCVSNLPPVVKYFLSGAHAREINDASPTKGALANAFGELIRELWSAAQFSSARPAELKRVIGKVASRFTGYDQQDAQEFLRFLLDGLHEDLNKIRKKPAYYEIKDREGAKDRDVSDEYWKFYLERNSSPLSELFCGQLRSEIRCNTCNNRSLCFDVFWDLSVPVPKKKSSLRMPGGLFSSSTASSRNSDGSSSDSAASNPNGCSIHDCLKAYTEQECLAEHDAYYCSKCKAHRAVSKKISVYRLPPVLVIHLKRFSFSTFSRDKVSTAVNYPALTLDVAEYCAPDAVLDGSTMYDLTGVVHHMGSLNGGHYTAECLNSDTNEWFDFNDSSVSPVRKPELCSSSAYMLFYRRREEQSLTI